MDQTTLVLVKPEAVKRGLTGEIIKRIEQRGLRLVGLKRVLPARVTVEEHYAEHSGKPFYESIVGSLSTSPIVAMAVRGPEAVQAIRTMMGATKPVEAAPGTIRGDFGLTIEDNVTHSAADPGAAERELKIWFPDGFVE